MSETPKASREFWVLPAYRSPLCPDDNGACFDTPQGGLIHVIEHSAYLELQREVEKLKAQLSRPDGLVSARQSLRALDLAYADTKAAVVERDELARENERLRAAVYKCVGCGSETVRSNIASVVDQLDEARRKLELAREALERIANSKVELMVGELNLLEVARECLEKIK